MRGTGRILSFLILLCALASALCACGQAADSSGLSGSYDLAGAADDDLILTDEAATGTPLHFRLDPGGTGIVSDGERTGRLTWSESEGFVMIEGGGILLGGSVDGADLLLKAAGSDTVLRFVPADVPSPDAEEEKPADSAENMGAENAAVFSWYGWWKITESDGSMPLSWYDCCARLRQIQDSAYQLTVWDEDGSAAEPLATVTFRDEGDGHLISLYGTWMFDDIDFGEWNIDIPSEVLCMENLKHDANGTAFTYSFYLRNWGDRWKSSPKEQLPFYFDDWYLVLLKEKADMPDRIPAAELEKERETIQG